MRSETPRLSDQNRLDQYLDAAVRENTRISYRSAVRHFEIEWGGFLPATADAVARYLATYADTLSAATLRQRMAALAQWHIEQGFPDPTKTPIVRKVLRGIRALHPVPEKQARPLQLDQLNQAVAFLEEAMVVAHAAKNKARELRCVRDRSLLLLGFWRGFRVDELTRLQVKDVEVIPGQGMTCRFFQTKTDRTHAGTLFSVPALARLCPVNAYLDWLSVSQLADGAVFRSIDRWGHIAEQGLHPDSVIPMLRSLLREAGIASSELFSGHSLRRGFASWAAANGWDVKTLMKYIGWRDIKSAIRYIDTVDPYHRRHFDLALPHKE